MAIMGSHNPWASIFGILGNIISLLVYLAPVPTFCRIYKKKCTEGFQSVPYLVALFSSSLWLYYALLKIHDSFPLITINSFGCVIELIYIFIYLKYAHKDAKNLTIKLGVAMNIGSFALVLSVTYFALHGSVRVKVLGWICVGVSMTVFASPLSIIRQVYRTKSVQFMPFGLSFFLTLNAIMWLAYGYFQKDLHVAIPNVLGIALGIIQMLVYAFYKMNGGKKEQALEGMMNIVVLNPLGPAEVFPITVDDEQGLVVDDINQQLQENNNNNNNNNNNKGAEEEQEKRVQVNNCPV